MGVQIDLIVPPVIIGLLIILLFRINAFMLETSTDSRLINDVQTKADIAIDIIQEELRGLDGGQITISVDTLRFTKFLAGSGLPSQSYDIVRDNNNGQLKIFFQNLITGVPDSTVYDLNLSSIDFSMPAAHLLRVRVQAESRAEQHVRFRNDTNVIRSVAERDFFLRHRTLPNTNPPLNNAN
ncbi:MAG: hypothetical protein EA359_17615 [Balneolaceae bacterium]|jgi:hypothetical protein|nr:MAG: hypothetical protein EA359_17615 [Balneolaceae bacterium]